MKRKPRATMQAVAVDHFGGIDAMKERKLPVPDLEPNDVLVRVAWAGVGEWDPFEREGGFVEILEGEPAFPYVLGSEGAGVVADVGPEVKDVMKGDRVYAVGLSNAKGGFYAQYAVVDASHVCPIPSNLPTEQGAVMPIVGATALRGLEDVLGLEQGESILIFGASGGVGHLAVQIAKRMGARVLAIASGPDGVALAKRLGADEALDGHGGDILGGAEAFAPGGLDTALLTAGGKRAEEALRAIRKGGRVAYPKGVEPVPRARDGLRMQSYDSDPDHELLGRLNRIFEAGKLEAYVSQTFELGQAAAAHRAIEKHHLGKLALHIP
jgi:NADPH:quinone reductase